MRTGGRAAARGGPTLVLALALAFAGCATHGPSPRRPCPSGPIRPSSWPGGGPRSGRASRACGGRSTSRSRPAGAAERVAGAPPHGARPRSASRWRRRSGCPRWWRPPGPMTSRSSACSSARPRPRGRRRRPSSGGSASRWRPTTLIRLLVGNVPPPADPRAVVVEDAPSPHLVWTRGRDAAPGLGDRGGAPGAAPARERPGAAAASPRTSSGAARAGSSACASRRPERGAELTVRYLSAEYVENPPEAFRLVLPAGRPCPAPRLTGTLRRVSVFCALQRSGERSGRGPRSTWGWRCSGGEPMATTSSARSCGPSIWRTG